MKRIPVVGAAIFNEQGLCLIAQRSDTMANPLKWEFPGGKIEQGESPQDALRREIWEELQLVIEVGDWIAQGCATIDAHRQVVLDVYNATYTSGQIALAEHAQAIWVNVQDFETYDWALADIPIVDEMMLSV